MLRVIQNSLAFTLISYDLKKLFYFYVSLVRFSFFIQYESESEVNDNMSFMPHNTDK